MTQFGGRCCGKGCGKFGIRGKKVWRMMKMFTKCSGSAVKLCEAGRGKYPKMLILCKESHRDVHYHPTCWRFIAMS